MPQLIFRKTISLLSSLLGIYMSGVYVGVAVMKYFNRHKHCCWLLDALLADRCSQNHWLNSVMWWSMFGIDRPIWSQLNTSYKFCWRTELDRPEEEWVGSSVMPSAFWCEVGVPDVQEWWLRHQSSSCIRCMLQGLAIGRCAALSPLGDAAAEAASIVALWQEDMMGARAPERFSFMASLIH